MTNLKRVSAALVAFACISMAGCVATPAQESAGVYLSDSWITTKVKAALVNDPVVKATEVNVETMKGEVQLSGFVSSQAATVRAVSVARGIEGVKAVRNDMRIK